MYGLSIGTTSGQVGDHVLPLMRFWVIMEKTVPNSCDVVTVTNVDTDNVQVLKQFISTFFNIFTTKNSHNVEINTSDFSKGQAFECFHCYKKVYRNSLLCILFISYFSLFLLPFLFIVYFCMYVFFSFDATIMVNKDVYISFNNLKAEFSLANTFVFVFDFV